ncbi:hypothetical protein [Crinalium epipsammum]|uniref:hypothetical protein n=1 Tax=Crinalium epipsammum TaxID=241425 RepID=UPI00030DE09C|nr:hypothetical protein [Crinalium epipsammum]
MFNGQFIFDYDNWHIVIGTLDNCHELEEKLDDEGGYGITHLCKVEKLDGALFSLDESYKIIKAFCYYLSFARGFWIAPILLSGFDSEGNELFEEWRTPILPCDSYRPSHSWMPYSDSLDIVDIYPGFVDKWKDEVWHITIKNTIEWYIESLNTNLNTGIILVQASLEKIAWTYLKSNECLNSDGFQGIRASNQIRLLLKFLNINIEPLDNYVEVKKKAKELNWDDTIVAVIEVRNAIVHPRVKKSKNSEFLSDELLRETFWIGHNYLEQCLLKLFCSNYPFD